MFFLSAPLPWVQLPPSLGGDSYTTTLSGLPHLSFSPYLHSWQNKFSNSILTMQLLWWKPVIVPCYYCDKCQVSIHDPQGFMYSFCLHSLSPYPNRTGFLAVWKRQLASSCPWSLTVASALGYSSSTLCYFFKVTLTHFSRFQLNTTSGNLITPPLLCLHPLLIQMPSLPGFCSASS